MHNPCVSSKCACAPEMLLVLIVVLLCGCSAPSEHTLGGERYEAEMQIVHQKEGSSGNSDLLILSLLFTHGPENPFLKSLAWTEKGLPKASGNSTEIGTVDLNVFGKLLQDSFFCYQGSLTVPPCEETVSWKVMADPTTMSHAQQKAVCGLFEQNPNFAGKYNIKELTFVTSACLTALVFQRVKVTTA